VQEEIKKSNCGWEACSRLLEQLSLLNTILHYPGGDLCIFFDVLIGPSFSVNFHISQRECKCLKKNVHTFSALGKSCTISNICTAILKVGIIV
jgi:hypothetical protein